MVTGVTDALGMIIGLSKTMEVRAGYSYSRNWDVGQGEAVHTSTNIMGMIPVWDIVMASRNPCVTHARTRVTHACSKTLKIGALELCATPYWNARDVESRT